MRTKSSYFTGSYFIYYSVFFLSNISPATGIVTTCWFGWKYKTNHFFSLASHGRVHTKEQTTVINYFSLTQPFPSAGKNMLSYCRLFPYREPHRNQCRVIIYAPKFTSEQKPRRDSTPALYILLRVLNGTFLVALDYEQHLFFPPSSLSVTRTNTKFLIAQHCIALQFWEDVLHQLYLFQSEQPSMYLPRVLFRLLLQYWLSVQTIHKGTYACKSYLDCRSFITDGEFLSRVISRHARGTQRRGISRNVWLIKRKKTQTLLVDAARSNIRSNLSLGRLERNRSRPQLPCV